MCLKNLCVLDINDSIVAMFLLKNIHFLLHTEVFVD